MMARGILISRIALAVALTVGTVAALPVAAVAKEKAAAAKITNSPEFVKAIIDLNNAVGNAKSNAALSAASAKAQAATAPADRAAAAAEVDAALGGADAKIAAATPLAKTPGDKVLLGQLVLNVATLKGDAKRQNEGAVMMLDSGGLQPSQVAQLSYVAGATAYQSGDFQGALKYLKPAYDSGYRDSSNQIGALLADTYKRTGNSGAVLAMANQDLAASRASGAKPSETAIRTALQAAYDSKNVAASTDLSVELARNYPSPATWNTAIDVVRALSQLPAQDNLDLMRLMARTNSLTDKRDYLEYLQNADPRRLPGETLRVLDAGVSSGKLTSAEVADYRQVASGRLSADKASLPGLERDAHAGSANARTVAGAGDAFLSYDQPAKAEELYKLALAKPGVEKDTVLTRLGIAQSDQGKYADAQQSFSQVGGTRASMAKLWSAYVATKSGSATGATPAS